MGKDRHEFRDPVHDFVVVSGDERRVVDSRPVQRLREIHQLAMSYLVYPGATHRRFEHSLGVMELAGQVFDALMDRRHLTDAVREALPGLDEQQKVDYYRQVVRLAGLLHDVGHLPFSHAAEEELLPEGRCHEHLTVGPRRGSTRGASLRLPKPLAELPRAAYDGVFIDAQVYARTREEFDGALPGILTSS
jgi:HD superfamily phosphohydrolase